MKTPSLTPGDKVRVERVEDDWAQGRQYIGKEGVLTRVERSGQEATLDFLPDIFFLNTELEVME